MKLLYRTLLITTLPFFFFLTSCERNPVTGKEELHLVSQNYEIEIGNSQYLPLQQIEGSSYTADKNLTTYIQNIGSKLAALSERPDLPYEFTIINSSIPNAWALPGGKIAINRGLLLKLENEAELAAVLSHEIVHAAARHGAQTIERSILLQGALIGVALITTDSQYQNAALGTAALGTTLINQKYGRNAEFEADKYGIRYMSRAGYDPQAAVNLQKLFLRLSKQQRQNWIERFFASHPPSKERILENENTIKNYPRGGYLGTQEYQKKIAHLENTKEAYNNLEKGEQQLERNRPESALIYATKALEIEPNEPLFYNLKGESLERLGRYKEALNSYHHSLSLNPNFYKTYLLNALLYKKINNNTLALKNFKKSIHQLPTSLAYLEIGELYLEQGDQIAAIKALKIAAQDNQTNTGEKAREWIIYIKNNSFVN
jgi:beta-barrel assembly-enhancing protease